MKKFVIEYRNQLAGLAVTAMAIGAGIKAGVTPVLGLIGCE